MAFSAGGSGTTAEINVTPLIDVLLVLLIIFMVLVPVMPHGIEALVPQPPKSPQQVEQPEQPVVVQVKALANGAAGYEINHQPYGRADLGPELQRLMTVRRDKVLFVRGDRDLQFSDIAEVVGMAHAANAERIGILTPQADAGR